MIESSNISQIRAQDYLNRVRVASGTAISAAERLNLVAFCQGLSDLSISPVGAWTARSAQGPGTGATLPALFGDWDITWVNGPTHGADGTTLNGTTQYGSLPSSFPELADEFSLFCVYSGSRPKSQFYRLNVLDQIRLGYALGTSASTANRVIIGGSSTTTNNGMTTGSIKHSCQMSWKINTASTGLQSFIDGASFAGVTSPNSTFSTVGAIPYIGSVGGASGFMIGEISFLMVIKSVAFSASDLHNLYADTLGQGII